MNKLQRLCLVVIATGIIAYLPNVLAAVFILGIGLLAHEKFKMNKLQRLCRKQQDDDDLNNHADRLRKRQLRGTRLFKAHFTEIIAYLPNVLAAVFILGIGLLAGQLVSRLLAGMLSGKEFRFLAPLAKYTIITLSILDNGRQILFRQDRMKVRRQARNRPESE
jgi:MFS superfamily sulfate permease-like transporter